MDGCQSTRNRNREQVEAQLRATHHSGTGGQNTQSPSTVQVSENSTIHNAAAMIACALGRSSTDSEDILDYLSSLGIFDENGVIQNSVGFYSDDGTVEIPIPSAAQLQDYELPAEVTFEAEEVAPVVGDRTPAELQPFRNTLSDELIGEILSTIPEGFRDPEHPQFEENLRRAVSNVLYSHRGELAQNMAQHSTAEVRIAIRTLARRLEEQGITSENPSMTRILAEQFTGVVYRHLVDQTRQGVISRAESHIRNLRNLSSPEACAQSIERLSEALSNGRITRQQLETTLMAMGLTEDQADSYSRNLSQLSESQRNQMIDELRDGSSQLSRNIRQNLIAPLQSSWSSIDSRVGVMTVFRDVAQDVLQRDFGVTLEDGSFAEAAVRTMESHEQHVQELRQHRDTFILAVTSAILLPAAGIAGPLAFGIGLANDVAQGLVGHEQAQGTVEQAELGHLVGASNQGEVDAARSARNTQDFFSAVSVGVTVGGDFIPGYGELPTTLQEGLSVGTDHIGVDAAGQTAENQRQSHETNGSDDELNPAELASEYVVRP